MIHIEQYEIEGIGHEKTFCNRCDNPLNTLTHNFQVRVQLDRMNDDGSTQEKDHEYLIADLCLPCFKDLLHKLKTDYLMETGAKVCIG